MFILMIVIADSFAYGQIYLLNEDFQSAVQTTPPAGWNNLVITGSSADKWHFDNPGNKPSGYPITAPFAIFDAGYYPPGAGNEVAALETPLFNGAAGSYCLLFLDHYFKAGAGAAGKIMAFNGQSWQEVTSFTTTTATNPRHEIVDLTPYCAGNDSAKVRFQWEGSGEGYWEIDNIQVYSPLGVDAGISNLDQPAAPFAAGPKNVAVTVTNFGYQALTSATIQWSVNGVAKPPFSWTGNLPRGGSISNVTIGSFTFAPNTVYQVKAWTVNPNGIPDPYHFNDTIASPKQAALCGIVTVGGTNPTFPSIGSAVGYLSAAGILCPSTINLRNGTYTEGFILMDIQGLSATNTLTIKSESGDSTKVVIQVPYLSNSFAINNVSHIFVKKITTHGEFYIFNTAGHISISGCRMDEGRSYIIRMAHGTHDVTIKNNLIMGRSYTNDRAIYFEGGGRDILIENNRIESYLQQGIIQQYTSSPYYMTNITIRNNIIRDFITYDNFGINIAGDSIRILNNQVRGAKTCINITGPGPFTVSGNRIDSVPNTGIASSASNCTIANNYITMRAGNMTGISLNYPSNTRVVFNNINNCSEDENSRAFYVSGGANITVKNNIFSSLAGYCAVVAYSMPALDLDYNGYWSGAGRVGRYYATSCATLADWQAATGKEVHAVYACPFFTGISNLKPNQFLLNNTANPVPGILYDIDSVLRNPIMPDIGAKEFALCSPDAGISQITSPQAPLLPGVQEVRAILQNQGEVNLSSVTIRWSVNGISQPAVPWTGMLLPGAMTGIILGNYNFLSTTTYEVKAWTENPNGMPDCNPLNNISGTPVFYPKMCGTFTIGGAGPDFNSITEALTHLVKGGISCPVTFLLRNNTYTDQIVLGNVSGASPVNTITFQSESGDSSAVYINASISLSLAGAQYMRFRGIHFEGASIANSYDIKLLNCWMSGYNTTCNVSNSLHVLIDRCYLKRTSFSEQALSISSCSNFSVTNSCIENGLVTDKNGYTCQNLLVKNCTVNFITITRYNNVDILNNRILVNHIDTYYPNRQTGIYGVGVNFNIMNNRVIINSAAESYTGITGEFTNSTIGNNYITGSGIFQQTGIDLTGGTNTSLFFNTINLLQDLPGSRAIRIRSTPNIILKNNIFSLMGNGIAADISGMDTTGITLDYNDYFSISGKIGTFGGNVFTTFSAWQNRMGGEQHGFNLNPFIASAVIPLPGQVQLNNAGIPVTGVLYDIDSTLRNPVNPDIGAREFSPCMADAGINAIVAPVSPFNGSQAEVRMVLQNQGTEILTSVTLQCRINGVNQPPVSWTGSLAGSDTAIVSLGSYPFVTGVNRLRAWTRDPNNGTDCNHANDTAAQKSVYPLLCGVYTIGGSNPDFVKLSDAVEVLNNTPINCSITFRFRNGVYPEPFALYGVEGSSALHTITFGSESSDSASVVIAQPPTLTPYPGTISLLGQNFVTIRALTVKSVNYSTGVWIEGAHDINISHCYLYPNTPQNAYVSQSIKIVNSSVVRVDSNNLRNAFYGLLLEEVTNLSCRGNVLGNFHYGLCAGVYTQEMSYDNLLFDNNIISQTPVGLYLFITESDSITIRKNLMRNLETGIQFYQMTNSHPWLVVEQNQLLNITNEGFHIYYSGTFWNSNSLVNGWIRNNFIHTCGGNITKGISLNGAKKINVSFNSLNNRSTNALSAALFLNVSDSITARDNIFSSVGGGYCCYFQTAPTRSFMDYNNYYSGSARFGCINGVNYPSFASWKSAIGGEASGKNIQPYFASDTSFHVYQRHLNGAGVPIPGITRDVEGDLRNVSSPDIGADEFKVDFGITEVLHPSGECVHPAGEHVTVRIRQLGDIPYNTIPLAYSVNGGTPYSQTIGGWVFGDTVFAFTPVINFSVAGTYVIKCWMTGNFDDNIGNDTLTVTRGSSPSPVPDFTWQHSCAGDLTAFSGTASIVPPYSVAEYTWNFGDGGVDSIQNPVHSYASPAIYTVAMRAYSNMGCYSEKTHTVQVAPGPMASFTALAENCSNSPVLFDDNSTIAVGSIASWIYDFGDGVTDTIVPPASPDVSHSYAASGTYQAVLTVTAADGCRSFDTAVVVIEKKPGAGFNNSFPACVGLPVMFTDTTVLNGSGPGISWQWNFGDPASGVSDTSSLQNPSHLFSVPGNFLVTLIVIAGGCPDTATAGILAGALPQPTISGPSSALVNTTALYSTEAGMLEYNWDVTGGMIFTGGGTSTVTVSWTSPGTQSICVNYSNPAGCEGFVPTCQAVEVQALPGASGIITGIAEVCRKTYGVVYSVDSIPYATTYQWTVPPGAVIATGSGTNAITVDYTGMALSGDVIVQGINANGMGLPSPVFPVIVNPLPVPSILGSDSACAGSASNIYVTENGMAGYTWNISQGGVITAGQGSDTIHVTWNDPGKRGVTVTYTSTAGCPAESPTCKIIVVNPLPFPSISGENNPCEGNDPVGYHTEFGMTGYQWVLTGGGTITSGQGTPRVFITWSVPGVHTIGVNYVTPAGCTLSQPVFNEMTVKPLPEQAGAITGSDTVCRGDAGVHFRVAGIPNASEYIWSLPPGAEITDGYFTPEILVNFSDTASSGNISVYGINDCGEGRISQLFPLVVEGCTGIPEHPGTGISLYPNPTRGMLTLDLTRVPSGSTVNVRVFNILGVEIMSRLFRSSGTHSISLEHQVAGVYEVVVSGDGRSYCWKIVKE